MKTHKAKVLRENGYKLSMVIRQARELTVKEEVRRLKHNERRQRLRGKGGAEKLEGIKKEIKLDEIDSVGIKAEAFKTSELITLEKTLDKIKAMQADGSW